MKIAVLAEQTLFADLLSSELESDGNAVTTISLSKFLAGDVHSFDALIIHLTKFNSFELDMIRGLKARSGASLLVLAPKDAVERAVRSLRNAVDAVLPDDKPLPVLKGSLALLAAGYSLVSSRLSAEPEPGHPGSAHYVPNGSAGAGLSEGRFRLSRRELMVLKHVLEGESNKEIANSLDISDSTVKVHLRSIFQKTNTKNRTQAALWAEHNLS